MSVDQIITDCDVIGMLTCLLAILVGIGIRECRNPGTGHTEDEEAGE